MRVAIIGAGIIGLALARELRPAGDMVTLVDCGRPGRGATWAAAGMLAPSAEGRAPGPFFDLCRAAATFYPDFIAELEADTRLRTGYDCGGSLAIYHTDGQRAELERGLRWQREAGVPLVHLDRDEMRTTEPAVRAAGAFLLPGDSQVDNRLLADALLESCRRSKVEIVNGRATEVLAPDGRAIGVRLEDGRLLEAEAVVNAAGAWAAQVQAPGVEVPARPVKGHMLALTMPRSVFRMVLHDPAVYLVPRHGGRVVVGSTMEEAGFDATVKNEVIETLRESAIRLVPQLAEAPVTESWIGFRPALPDHLPRIGPTSLPGYFVAAGHFRNGILLGPITARLLTPVIRGARPDPLLVPFLPS